jgi:membrane-associated phospholipid phosphatase
MPVNRTTCGDADARRARKPPAPARVAFNRVALMCVAIAVRASLCGGQTPPRAPVASGTGDSASAVVPPVADADSLHATRRKSPPWVTRNDLFALGGGIAGTLLLAPLDYPISDELYEPRWKTSRRVHQLAGDVAFFGGDGPFVASVVLLAGSSVGHGVALRRFAVHNIESIALATIITGIGKGISGRALPGVHAKSAFQFGRGFHDANGPFVSFPSGHTAAAFAFASTIAGELAYHDSTRVRLYDGLAYGGAAAVGVARLVQHVHWPSDLPLAAVIGTWSGRAIQRHASDAGVLGAVLRGISVTPGASGRANLGWSSLAAENRGP